MIYHIDQVEWYFQGLLIGVFLVSKLQPIASLKSVVRKDFKNKAGNVPEGSISTQEEI